MNDLVYKIRNIILLFQVLNLSFNVITKKLVAMLHS